MSNNDPQKFLVYVMPDKGAHGPPGHKFMTLRRTEKNAKGRYVTRDEFYKTGLFWPTSHAATRDELAMKIGQAILDEAGL